MRKILFILTFILCLSLQAQVGIDTTMPESTLDVNGSLSLSITNTSGNLTLDDTNYTVIITGNHNITLPAANSCTGRIYIIKNPTSNTSTISSYNDLSGNASTAINAQTTISIQSDGSSWEQISLGTKVFYEKVVIWAEETQTLESSAEEWSFGNGDTGFVGIPLPEEWVAYAVSFHADNTAGAPATMIMGVGDISANNVFTELFRFTASGAIDNMSYTEVLAVPVTIPAGTTLAFRSITETGDISSARVAVWLRRLP